MKKLGRLILNDVKLTPTETKHILGGFSDYSGEIPGECKNAVTASCADGCKEGCKECKDGCKEGCKPGNKG